MFQVVPVQRVKFLQETCYFSMSASIFLPSNTNFKKVNLPELEQPYAKIAQAAEIAFRSSGVRVHYSNFQVTRMNTKEANTESGV